MSRYRVRNVCTSEEQLAEIVEAYSQFDEFVFDVETRGEWRGKPHLAQVTWLSLAGPGRADVIPMGHINGRMLTPPRIERVMRRNEDGTAALNSQGRRQFDVTTHPPTFEPPPKQLWPSKVFAALEPVFFSDKRKIGHNVRFDLTAVAKYYDGRVPPPPYGDTIVMTHLLNENLGAYRLDFVIDRVFGLTYSDGKLGKTGIDLYSYWAVAKYAALDSYYAWLLWRNYFPHIEKQGLSKVFDLEMDVLEALIYMEWEGALIDVEMMDDLRERVNARIDTVKEKLYSDVGKVWNLDNPLEKGHYVYNVRGHKPRHFTDKKNQPSTRSIHLEEFKGRDPMVGLLVEYAELAKLRSTYIDGMSEHLVLGKLHPSFLQSGTATGRFSCVSEDSLIEMPRNLAEFPDGVPITKVAPGDWVYAFDWQRELVLKRVKWVGQTGIRRTVVVTVQNSEGHRLQLRLTPEHLVRLRNGDWRPAGSLMHKWGGAHRDDGPRVMTMVRRIVDDGYIKFFPHSVARKNGVKGGGKSREHRWVVEQSTGKRISTKTDVHHIDGSRANNSVDNLEVLTIAQHRGRKEIHRNWGKGREEELLLYTGPTDYRVISVEEGFVEPVWDMEVEDVHNFIANGICVHNCASPNLQNLPRETEDRKDLSVRSLFVAPEGHSLIVADYSQIEYRLFAHFSKDPYMISSFNAGIDAHTSMACMILGKTPEDLTGEERTTYGKIVNFALGFSAGPRTLADQAGVSLTKAKEIMAAHRQASPRFYAWKDWEISRAKRRKPPHVRTLLGRKRRLPTLFSDEDGLRWHAERQAINTIIQGSAADIMKLAIVRAHAAFKDTPVQPILTVHDELVTVCPEGMEAEAVEKVREAMEGAVELRLPLVADIKVCKRWSEGK